MKLIFTLILLCTATCSSLYANSNPDRPKVGLVLSGGGARGAAHIGVIETLEELNVPIDIIVGTSMGAVIGGLYASGVPIETLKHDLCDVNWETLFKQDIKRKDLYYRRKEDDQLFIAKNFIGMINGKIRLSLGLTSGQNLYQMFKSYTLDKEPMGSFHDLPIPFTAVSTDLLTGDRVALTQGDLGMALLGSMAVPGIIAPVQLNHYMLIDGGVSDNLPVEIARQMGADILIVVNVSTPLYDKSQIYDLRSVLGQITNIMTNNNIVQSKKALQPQDIYIEPNLTNIDTTEFSKFEQGVNPGRVATWQVRERLLTLSEDLPTAPMASPYRVTPLRLNHVIVSPHHRMCSKTYADYLHFESTLVTVKDINHRISRLYGLNVFERIYYGIDEHQNLAVEPHLKPKRTLLFQESILFRSDFRDDSQFSFVLGITNPHHNNLLGEWRLIGEVGSNVAFLAEYYQPLEPSLSWFVNPYTYANRSPIILYYDFEEIARFIDEHYEAGFRIGYTFSNVARLFGFIDYAYDNYNVTISEPPLTRAFESQWSEGGTFEWDVLDNLYFPHHGFKGNVSVYRTHSRGSIDNDFSQMESKALAACSSGRHSFVLAARYDTSFNGNANLISQFGLGGLFQLTGLQYNELLGENAALATAIYYYEVKKMEIIPNRPFPIYAGLSFESGNVWGERNISPRHQPLYANSIFVGTDTIIGPIYLGAGATYNGRKAVHLLIGPFF